MIQATFAGQNWLITPASSPTIPPVDEPPAATASEAAATGHVVGPATPAQTWLLVLSGVAIANFQGTSTADWRRDTLVIEPDLTGPINWAISNYGAPPVAPNFPNFQVLQWAPYAALSSIFDQDQSVDAGFAVDTWRPNPFRSISNTAGGLTGQVFTGVQVDLAVRDTDATIFRVAYNFTLIGHIVGEVFRG